MKLPLPPDFEFHEDICLLDLETARFVEQSGY